jgi:hypothetical protein
MARKPLKLGIATKSDFVFAQPRPIATLRAQHLLRCDEATSGTLVSPATMLCPGLRARR